MDVAFSCDDAGARFLRVTVWSLLKHYRGTAPLRINVFEGFGGHSAESKRLLAEVVAKFPGASVRYLNVERVIEPYADLIMNRTGSRWNVFTWTPIFTPLLLSDVTGNVAHFDIDMLFNDDVSKLLELDLGDNLIAAVAEYGKGDPVITDAVWGSGILPPEADRYFNTGTIVFNAEKCRAEKTWEKILAWYREHYDIADRIEQDAWNALYWRRTLPLPLRWNFHDRLVKRFSRSDALKPSMLGHAPRDCFEAAVNPAILHFWGPKKPWKPCHRPYRKLYHEAMLAVGQTPPNEQFGASLHDFMSSRKRQAIASWLRDFDLLNSRAWRRHCRWKKAKHAVLIPFEWLGIALAMSLIVWMPRRVLFAFCDLLSRMMYRLDGRGRRRSLENLHILRNACTGLEGSVRFDPDVGSYRPTQGEERIIRRSYRNMARTVGYAFWTCVRAKARCMATGEMDARASRFLAVNRPAVTVSGHVGCWEILSQLAHLEGHRMMSVAKRIGTGGMTALLMRARRSIGQEIVLADGAFKTLMKGLREGKSLGLLVDQRVSPRDGGVWVRFLGRPIPVSAAPAFFAAKAKVPIIVAWSRPLKDGRYRCEAVDEIPAEEARDVWATTQRCAADLERIMRRHPSCWALNYNFFSTVPSERDLQVLAEREGGVR